MAKPVRIHLGSGDKHWPGWLNVDSCEGAYISSDVRKLECFGNEYADEIQAIHLFEHLYRWEAPAVLVEWKRVLKPGGLLVLELPSFEKIMKQFAAGVRDERMIRWGLFGDPGYGSVEMTHKWSWTHSELAAELQIAGFENVQVQEPIFHIKERDFRICGRKPLSQTATAP